MTTKATSKGVAFVVIVYNYRNIILPLQFLLQTQSVE